MITGRLSRVVSKEKRIGILRTRTNDFLIEDDQITMILNLLLYQIATYPKELILRY